MALKGEGKKEVWRVANLEFRHPELHELLDLSLDELLASLVEQTLVVAENDHVQEIVQVTTTGRGIAAIYRPLYKGIPGQIASPPGSWAIYLSNDSRTALYWSEARHGGRALDFTTTPPDNLPEGSLAAELMIWHLCTGVYFRLHPEAMRELGVSQIPPFNASNLPEIVEFDIKPPPTQE